MNKTLLGLIFVTSNICAQSVIETGVFLATPVGKMASSDLQGSGGFTQVGYGGSINIKQPLEFLPEGFGYFAHVSYQWNELDRSGMESAFSEVLESPVKISESRHSPVVTAIGPCYNIGWNKLTLSLESAIGIMFNNTNAIAIEIFDNGTGDLLGKEVFSFFNLPSFTYLFGASLSYEIVADKMALTVFANYNASNQKTELTFTSATPIDSNINMQFLNSGLRLTFNVVE